LTLKPPLVWLYAQIKLWITYYCDKLPDKEEYHAPIYYTLSDLHKDFCQTPSTKYDILELPQYPAFTAFWKKFFKCVKFPDKNYLSKCDTCTEIKESAKLKGKQSLG
jgi:hypothetical protein